MQPWEKCLMLRIVLPPGIVEQPPPVQGNTNRRSVTTLRPSAKDAYMLFQVCPPEGDILPHTYHKLGVKSLDMMGFMSCDVTYSGIPCANPHKWNLICLLSSFNFEFYSSWIKASFRPAVRAHCSFLWWCKAQWFDYFQPLRNVNCVKCYLHAVAGFVPAGKCRCALLVGGHDRDDSDIWIRTAGVCS